MEIYYQDTDITSEVQTKNCILNANSNTSIAFPPFHFFNPDFTPCVCVHRTEKFCLYFKTTMMNVFSQSPGFYLSSFI